ncbi:hypothetical protein, partial [Endozoicomonas sp. SESOKO4]|uniref:hypothetical protein n=1 Tax=Endozoicomonas sp. SESOKO4 TaxID=2828745 RepID=UPI00214828FC
ALKNQHFSHAEEKFQAILQEYEDQLSQADYQNSVIGLARSLKEQTPKKQKAAYSRLQELRLEEPLTELGASKIPNLDLTLSRCEQALGLLSDAETRLLRLRNINPDADEEILCQHSHNFDADITNARLWQFMEKHQMTETLLVNMKKELTNALQSNPYRATAKTLYQQLRTINMALARLLQERGLYEWAEELLLDISGKRSNNSEAFLCKPCRNNEINLALARLWQVMGKHERTEKLLLNMSGKHPNASEEILCRPFGVFAIDMALVRHWEIMNKHKPSGKLLLNMCDKHPDASEEVLCRPFGNLDIDLPLVRHWEITGNYHLAEKLLLNMLGKQPGKNKEILCQPCGNYDLNLKLARLWHDMGNYEWAESLLLNMCGKDPNGNEEHLCKPCGNNDIDLALIRNWEMLGKYEWAKKLLFSVAGKSPLASEEELCQPCGDFNIDLTLVRYWGIVGENKRSEKLLLNMSGKPPKATEELLCQPCGQPLIDMALVRTWEVMGDYKLCEKLLLNMIGKQPDDNEEDLCRPSGNHDVDLALVRLWQMMNKNERAQRLIKHCCDVYPTSECKLALLSLQAGTARFMKMMMAHQESANTLLLTSIHYFRLATRKIADDDPESGQDNLKKALEYVESALKKYPLSAGACSQKAHCLRMMDFSEEVWREWFNKAHTLDPGRVEKFKTDNDWRITEAIALQKVKHLAQPT